jgi:hypothetical protein
MAHEVAVRSERPGGAFRVVTRTIDELVEVMPGWAKALIAALAALALALAAGASLVALNNRRIGHQRRLMADDVDALAAAVLPDVPRRVGALLTSVAHQLDASPAAGGSFCDVFPLAAGRAGAVLGPSRSLGERSRPQIGWLPTTSSVDPRQWSSRCTIGAPAH